LKALNDPNPKPEQSQNQSIILSEQGLSLFDFNKKEKDNLATFKKLLGPPIFNADLEEKSRQRSPIGVVNVLTVSGFVGKVLTVECVQDLSSPNKKGNFSMSGNLQNVLQESVNIAKINAHNYLTEDQIKQQSQKNIHIHFTEAGTPKDGPSAGISICTAYLSLALNKPIPGHISMTGELSSSGEVCKIGNLLNLIIKKNIFIRRIAKQVYRK
jgi:Lon-like ATP-dependent protease